VGVVYVGKERDVFFIGVWYVCLGVVDFVEDVEVEVQCGGFF
jgi:hypothetical protein